MGHPADELIAKQNGTTIVNGLKLFTTPAGINRPIHGCVEADTVARGRGMPVPQSLELLILGVVGPGHVMGYRLQLLLEGLQFMFELLDLFPQVW